MKNMMMDLETMGLAPGCAVLSIGAVRFSVQDGLGDEFYAPIRLESCCAAGLTEDPSTRDWWERQNPEAKKLLRIVERKGTPSLKTVLKRFAAFVQYVPSTLMWGNGADFDNPILAAAYRSVGLPQPWGPFNGRCYRTLKNIAPGPKLARVGTYHNALDDAKSQALHAIALLKRHKKLEVE